MRALPDLLVCGGGLIGLGVAAEAARRGARVTLFTGGDLRGAASPASAGMLAPSVEFGDPAAVALALRARDRWPDWVARLAADAPLPLGVVHGALQLAADAADADRLRATLPSGSAWLDAAEVAAREPALAPCHGAAWHPRDGAVDVPAVLAALVAHLAREPHVTVVPMAVAALDPARGTVVTSGGRTSRGGIIVLAAGAWSPTIRGLPRGLPVAPMRGQLVSLPGPTPRHVVYAPGGTEYFLPRGDRLLVGATTEAVGFDPGVDPAGTALLTAAAARWFPAAATHAPLAWAGLRPMTPDGLPVVGRDPDHPAVIYATGHSRNGVLLMPLTAEVVTALAAGEDPGCDLSPWRPDRAFE